MGAGKYSEGWITVPGKGRRWRTSDGTYMLQRPAGSRLAGALQGAWSRADKALGGWLPGGGTPNALTRGYDRPTGQLRQRIEAAGVNPDSIRVANLSARRPIENEIARRATDAGFSRWGYQEFGGKIPLRGGVIGLYGANPHESVLRHELAHATDPSSLPDVGRALQGVSQALGNPPPLRALAGVALLGDARSEDYAESRSTLAPDGDPRAYGDSLRREGWEEMREAGLEAVGLSRPVRGLATRAVATAGGAALGAAEAAARPLDDWLTQRHFERMDAGQDLDPQLLEASKMLGKYNAAIWEQKRFLEGLPMEY